MIGYIEECPQSVSRRRSDVHSGCPEQRSLLTSMTYFSEFVKKPNMVITSDVPYYRLRLPCEHRGEAESDVGPVMDDKTRVLGHGKRFLEALVRDIKPGCRDKELSGRPNARL